MKNKTYIEPTAMFSIFSEQDVVMVSSMGTEAGADFAVGDLLGR